MTGDDRRAVVPRRAQRRPVVLPARCRTATGRSGDVEIVDLTGEGCRIFTKGVHVSEGLQIRIKPANFESLSGVVRWASRGYAGIEFDKPLYGPTAEHLQRTFAAKG